MKKRCSKCGEIKEESEFHNSKINKDGLQWQCKECEREYYNRNKDKICEYVREYYNQNKERIAKRRREYYKQNKKRLAEYKREYRKQHKEQIAEKKQEYQNRNKDRIVKWKREWQIRNKEQIAKHKREYRNQNKEQIAKKDREYYNQNKDRIVKWTREYRNQNKEQLNKKNREYGQTPKGKLCRKRVAHRRRALMKNAEATLTTEQWNVILVQQKNRCAKCKKRFTKKNPPTVDHIIPVSKGGGLIFGNVQALCLSCNSKKGNKLHRGFILTWCVNL